MKLRDNPCPRCGWKFPGFHICVDLSVRHPDEGLLKAKRTSTYKKQVHDRVERVAALRQQYAERDRQIVELYQSGRYGNQGIAKELKIAQSTVQKVLKRAEDEGLVTLRRRGHTLAHGAN